ncbi:MAG: hypothetical protein SFW35_02800 [Chitinophagales bacterium]|nr:hypothetical protein [Chitinophagales bacterium]
MTQKETIKFLEQRKQQIMQQAQKEIDAIDTTISILSRERDSFGSDFQFKNDKGVAAVKGKRGRKKGSGKKAVSMDGTTKTPGRRGRKPAGEGSLLETVFGAIANNGKFIKASDLYTELQKQFPDRKGPQFKVQLSSILNNLSKKGRIQINKLGKSNRESAWGLVDWFDERGKAKAEHV